MRRRCRPTWKRGWPSVADDDEAAAQLGIDYATEQAQELLAAGAPGIHFYPLNPSRSVIAIFENLALPLSR